MSSPSSNASLPPYDVVREEPPSGPDAVVLPVYNEMPILDCTLDAIGICYGGDVVVVDDASTDGSSEALDRRSGLTVLRNRENAGAGGVLLRGFDWALEKGYRRIVTMDSDGQHNACNIPGFLRMLEESGVGMVWGTRYPGGFTRLAEPFNRRQEINREITQRLRKITGWDITDSFCGFRAYTADALRRVHPCDTSYGMLLEYAIRAWKAGLRMKHHPVPLIYLDETRDFNQEFANAEVRRQYYHRVLDEALAIREP